MSGWAGIFPESVKLSELQKENVSVTHRINPKKYIAKFFNTPNRALKIYNVNDSFFHNVYEPAQVFTDEGDSKTVVDTLLRSFLAIKKRGEEAEGIKAGYIPAPDSLLEDYIVWLREQNWMKGVRLAALFEIDGKTFDMFILEQSSRNDDRSPLTGGYVR